MRQKSTNLGKKEQRQINQILNKEAQGDRSPVRDAESRTVAKQHRLKGRKGK